MESPAGIAELAFADFDQKPAGGEVSCYQGFRQEGKHDITLDLSGQKNLFASDQTPTPTRLIKNCDEVGLFEDLQHVNPFDIGFQRAAEQNVSGTPSRPEATPPNEGESLHTPQVYPLESTVNPVSRSNSCSTVDVEQLLATSATPPSNIPGPIQEGPPPLQLIQPQVITWLLPAQSVALPGTDSPSQQGKPASKAQPPFILPKPSSQAVGSSVRKRPDPILVSCIPPTAPEPSSASLTPTSQLPIKERLKAILHSNNLNRRSLSSPPKNPVKPKDGNKDSDCSERKRIAAWRYRNKVRNEHKDLRKQNAQLQQENHELRERITRLERELKQHKNHTSLAGGANQLPSSIALLINVPNILVPSSAPRK
ncbi:hypothetical protein KR009_008176 [Drosophila setifemur]|nr:hypothetical protein KR009_008176 [Drosophila setifemur]